jgi:monoamine oxidase
MSDRENMIIIGAGAAGLMAARELAGKYNITILEAHDVPGGRTLTHYPTPGIHIETGAEFIHGDLPITLSLLQEASIPYHPVNDDLYILENGVLKKEESWIEDWENLVRYMSQAPESQTMQELLDQHYPAAQYATLRDHITGYVEGYDLADLNKVSVRYLFEEWTQEQGTNYWVENGYTALINYLAKEQHIITGQQVQHITWTPGHVSVKTATNTYTAHKVILTVALNTLQSETITFSPALPAYAAAAKQIGWGEVIKFNLVFKNPFWKKIAEDVGFILSDEEVPTWWTQSPGSNILTGWLGGPAVERYRTTSEADMLDKAIASLSILFSIPAATIRQSLADSFISTGGYSYGMPGTHTARHLLNTPVSSTIYFAGEALYDGDSPGTVEAALHSGKTVADRVM